MSLITHLTTLAELNALVAARKDKLVVIDFHATWCGPCHAIAPKFEQLSTAYKSMAAFCKVDVDQAQEIAKEYGVRAMPTFIFIKGGTKVDEVRGANAAAIEAAIKKWTGASAGGASAFPGTGHSLSGPPVATSQEGGSGYKAALFAIVFFGLWWYLGPVSGFVDMSLGLVGPGIRAALRRTTQLVARPPPSLLSGCHPLLLRHSFSRSPSPFASALRAFHSSRASSAHAPPAPLEIFPRSASPRLRAWATAHPSDPEAQADLFAHLLRNHRDPEAAVEVVGRWEELTGLWKGVEGFAAVEGKGEDPPVDAAVAKAIVADDECFRLYLQALSSVAHFGSLPGSTLSEAVGPALAKVSAAPSRRAEVLAGVATPGAGQAEAYGTAAATTSTPLLAATPPLASTATGTTIPTATETPSPSKPFLSPTHLVTALFTGSARGKGGEARIASPGPSLWGLGPGAATAAKAGSEPIRVIVEEAKSPWWQRAGKFLIVTALYSFLLLSLLSLLLDSSGILRATAQTAPFTPTATPDASNSGGRGTTFKDVHGVEEAKHELYEIVEFLKDPKKFDKLGGRLPRGVLLTGPPGTGKTLLARAVAGEAGVNFFTASGSEFDEMYVGVGARRIRELFKAARKAAPAIIFIDELDAVGGKRSARDQHYAKQTLNQLLVELDGFTPGEGVILIGATNFPESLDKALLRPGRFDRHIVVPLPDVRGRMQILQHHMASIGYDKNNVDISMIARGTIGFSGADLQALVNQAAVKASADNAKAVRASHFEWAKERIMMGAARKSAYITEKDKLATAFHEGGHALVALYTPGAYPLQSVTVVPRGMALGYTLMLPEMDKNSHTLSEYRAKLDVAMGGRVAEELIYGKENVTDGASSDISNATSMASAMVRRFGFSDRLGPVAHIDSDNPTSPETQAIIESEVRGLIEAAQARAMALLKSKKVELERLAKALVEHETLDLAEVQRVVKGEKVTKSLET